MCVATETFHSFATLWIENYLNSQFIHHIAFIVGARQQWREYTVQQCVGSSHAVFLFGNSIHPLLLPRVSSYRSNFFARHKNFSALLLIRKTNCDDIFVCVRVCCVVIMHGFAVVSFLYAAVNSVKKRELPIQSCVQIRAQLCWFLVYIMFECIGKNYGNNTVRPTIRR